MALKRCQLCIHLDFFQSNGLSTFSQGLPQDLNKFNLETSQTKYKAIWDLNKFNLETSQTKYKAICLKLLIQIVYSQLFTRNTN